MNSLLVYKVCLRLLKNSSKAKLLSLMYVVSSMHFVGLYSITGSYFLFGTFYFLLSLWFWFRFEKDKKTSFYLISFFTFVLGVFSSEIVAVLPFIILLISKSTKKLKYFVSCFLVILTNLLINKFFAGAPRTQAFQFKFTSFPELFRWYILRAFGLPEGVRNGGANERLIIYFLFFLSIAVFTFGFLKNLKTIKKNLKTIVKYFLWLVIGALPFYFMPYHLNPIYFSLSFVAFLLILGKIMSQRFLLIYSLIFVFLSFFSVRLLAHTHWMIRRSNLAKYWIGKVKTDLPYSGKDEKEIVLFLPETSSKQDLQITLQNDKAFQLFYNDSSLKTVYKIVGQ